MKQLKFPGPAVSKDRYAVVLIIVSTLHLPAFKLTVLRQCMSSTSVSHCDDCGTFKEAFSAWPAGVTPLCEAWGRSGHDSSGEQWYVPGGWHISNFGIEWSSHLKVARTK